MEDTKKTPVERVMLYLTSELKTQLQDEAQKTFRSVNGQIEYLLKQALAKRKGQLPKVSAEQDRDKSA